MNFSILTLLFLITIPAHSNVCASLFQKPMVTSVDELSQGQIASLKELAQMEIAVMQIQNPLQRSARLSEVYRYQESLKEQSISIGVYYQIRDELKFSDQKKVRTQALERDGQREAYEILKELLEVHKKSPEEALFHFAKTGELESLVTRLISLGQLDPNLTNARKRTALMTAIWRNNKKATDALLELEKVDVLLTDKNGFNSFDYATHIKNGGAIKALKVKRPNIQFIKKSLEELEKIHQSMEFVEVKAGKFFMGEFPHIPSLSVEVELTNNYEFMSHPITQRQWALVMKDNPSKFIEGTETTTLNISGKKIKMQPDHPVETVSWHDGKKFITKLNKLSKNDDPLIYKIIPSHKKGYIYRLPTDAEWDYVARDRGQMEVTREVTREKIIPLLDWMSKNSSGSTYAVGQTKPLLLDGDQSKAIYDTLGNVREWVNDRHLATPKGGKNPMGAKSGVIRSVRGSSWFDLSEWSPISSHRGDSPNYKSAVIGIRLVRTPP